MPYPLLCKSHILHSAWFSFLLQHDYYAIVLPQHDNDYCVSVMLQVSCLIHAALPHSHCPASVMPPCLCHAALPLPCSLPNSCCLSSFMLSCLIHAALPHSCCLASEMLPCLILMTLFILAACLIRTALSNWYGHCLHRTGLSLLCCLISLRLPITVLPPCAHHDHDISKQLLQTMLGQEASLIQEQC